MRSTLKANEAMAQVTRERLEAIAALDAERAERRAAIAETVQLARDRGEQVIDAGRVLIARDGLHWLYIKRGLPGAYYEAGLKFRKDYERANGTGVISCLESETGASGGDGPTHAMIKARGYVDDALKALGTHLLRPYLIHVAAEGRMLTDEVFGDPKRSERHFIPLVIALDILARHYGMVR